MQAQWIAGDGVTAKQDVDLFFSGALSPTERSVHKQVFTVLRIEKAGQLPGFFI